MNGASPKKALKFVPDLRPSTGRCSAALYRNWLVHESSRSTTTSEGTQCPRWLPAAATQWRHISLPTGVFLIASE